MHALHKLLLEPVCCMLGGLLCRVNHYDDPGYPACNEEGVSAERHEA